MRATRAFIGPAFCAALIILAATAYADHLRSGTYVCQPTNPHGPAFEIQADGGTPGSFVDPISGDTVVESGGSYVYDGGVGSGPPDRITWTFDDGEYTRTEYVYVPFVIPGEPVMHMAVPMANGIQSGTYTMKGAR